MGRPVVCHNKNPRYYVERHLYDFFQEVLAEKRGGVLIEVGCGGSEWLPFFVKEFQFQVTGLDYSAAGCLLAESILKREQVKGTIINGDLFAHYSDLEGKFDVLITMGLVEHFDNSSEIISALRRFLKPGGTMITIIPNLLSFLGPVQKIINIQIYNAHLAINREALVAAHKRAGMRVLKSGYSVLCNLGLLNFNGLLPQHPHLWKIIQNILGICNVGSWFAELIFPFLKPNRVTSPYIICIAER